MNTYSHPPCPPDPRPQHALRCAPHVTRKAHQDVVKKLSPHRSGSRDSSLDEEQMTNLLSSSALQEGAGEAGEVGLTPKAGKDKASASLGNTMRCTVAYNPKTMSPFEDTGDELDLHVGDVSACVCTPPHLPAPTPVLDHQRATCRSCIAAPRAQGQP